MTRRTRAGSGQEPAVHTRGDTPGRPSVDRGLVPASTSVTCAEPVTGAGSVGGVRGERAQRARGQSPLCGPPAAKPQPADRAAERPPSNLDTPGVTRRDSRDRTRWLREVETRTVAHRTTEAQRFWKRAGERFHEVLDADGTREQAIAARRYFLGRSSGQMSRFEHVLACGGERVWVVCIECRRAKEQERCCQAQRLCLRCRLNEGATRRALFLRARKRARQRAKDRGLLAERRGGRWSEKLLTLTLPHQAANGVAGRVAYLPGGLGASSAGP